MTSSTDTRTPGSLPLRGVAFVCPRSTTIAAYNPGEDVPVFRVVAPTGDNPGRHVKKIAETLTRSCQQHGATLSSVGIAVAGEVDTDRMMITRASRMSHWKGYPIADILTWKTGVPVFLGNDAEARTIYEGRYNLDLDQEPFYSLYWGRGIGGAFAFPSGSSGLLVTPSEPGHIRVRSGEPIKMCSCGEPDHLDAHASGGVISDLIARGSTRGNLTRSMVQPLVDDVARVISDLLSAQPAIRQLVIGGQRIDLHEAIYPMLIREIGLLMGANTPRICRSVLEAIAPPEAALSLLDALDPIPTPAAATV